jgi:Zn-dependent protease
MSAPTQGSSAGGSTGGSGGSARTPPAGLPVGRFFGVPLFLSPSWLLVALLITLSYGGLVAEAVDGISTAGSYAVAFAFAVLLAASLLAHELGHTAVSLAFGMPVRRVVIFLLGGVSEIEKEPAEPSQEYLVAVAGPLVSLVLAAGSACVIPLTDPGSIARTIVLLLVWSNLAVAVFNLLPGLPLDGGRLVRAGVWQLSGDRLTGTRAAAWGGRGIAVLVLVGAIATVRPDGALGIGNVLLASLLAAFIWVGATQSLTSATVTARMPSIEITSLVRPTLTVPPDLPVAEALRRAWSSGVRALVVVDADGAPRALVSESHVMAVPEGRRPWTTVADVARPLEPGLVLADSLSGAEVVEAFRRTPASEYLVVGRDGGTVGVLAAADVARILQGRASPAGAVT